MAQTAATDGYRVRNHVVAGRKRPTRITDGAEADPHGGGPDGSPRVEGPPRGDRTVPRFAGSPATRAMGYRMDSPHQLPHAKEAVTRYPGGTRIGECGGRWNGVTLPVARTGVATTGRVRWSAASRDTRGHPSMVQARRLRFTRTAAPTLSPPAPCSSAAADKAPARHGDVCGRTAAGRIAAQSERAGVNAGAWGSISLPGNTILHGP